MFMQGGFLPSAPAVWLRSCATTLASSLRRLARLVRSDEGQAMVEYAVLLVLMGVVVMVVLLVLGNQVRNVFCNISGGLGLPRGPG
jgi:Flp pilus assembly pilin Flp